MVLGYDTIGDNEVITLSAKRLCFAVYRILKLIG